jgi:hypothetical protein
MHVDEGTLLLLRDEAPPDAPARAHVRDCRSCSAALADATSRAALLSEALAALDFPVDAAAAKAATRARLDRARADRPLPAWRRWPLGRAAVLLLVCAGAASAALTWSPLRSWRASRPVPASQPEPTVTPTPTRLTETSGIAVEIPDGRIAIVVRDAPPGTVVEVLWSAGAAVRVEGPAGSAFTYGDGRLQVDAPSGMLRVDLPRAARSATLEVDGRVWLERTGAGVTVHEPALERTDDLVRFVVPER